MSETALTAPNDRSAPSKGELSERLYGGGDGAAVIEQVVLNGDLARMAPAGRVAYYNHVCQSLGLNPFTRPFEYLELDGRLVLYARKDATEQLRKSQGISLKPVRREKDLDLGTYTVEVEAATPDGRKDFGTGVVSITREDGEWQTNQRTGKRYFKGNGNFTMVRGDALANLLMKAETKAKRRATLSICGLGWLDETEIETIPGARPVAVNVETGEIETTVIQPSEPTEAPERPARAQQPNARAKRIDYAASVERIKSGLLEAEAAQYEDLLSEVERAIAKYPDDWKQTATDTIAAVEAERERMFADIERMKEDASRAVATNLQNEVDETAARWASVVESWPKWFRRTAEAAWEAACARAIEGRKKKLKAKEAPPVTSAVAGDTAAVFVPTKPSPGARQISTGTPERPGQVQRLHAIAGEGGFSKTGVKRLLAMDYGFASSEDVTVDVYEEICTRLADPAEASRWNRDPNTPDMFGAAAGDQVDGADDDFGDPEEVFP